MQYRFLTFNDQRMSGVMPALEAHYCAGLIGQQIDDLALAFITPLTADDDGAGTLSRHAYLKKKRVRPLEGRTHD